MDDGNVGGAKRLAGLLVHNEPGYGFREQDSVQAATLGKPL